MLKLKLIVCLLANFLIKSKIYFFYNRCMRLRVPLISAYVVLLDDTSRPEATLYGNLPLAIPWRLGEQLSADQNIEIKQFLT